MLREIFLFEFLMNEIDPLAFGNLLELLNLI